MLCVISLLQGVKLINNNRIVGELKVTISPEYFQLAGVVKPRAKIYKDKDVSIVFPVLRTKNTWLHAVERQTIVKHTMLTYRSDNDMLLINLDEENPI